MSETMGIDGDPDPLALDLDPAHTLPPLGHVREWAATALRALADGHIHAVLLVATELVTNAHEHGGGPRQIRLDHNRSPCVVRIEVDDVDILDETVPLLGQSRLGTHRGRGLIIVDKLSTDWGIRSLNPGKTVWAHISCGDDSGNSNGITKCPDRNR